MYNTELREISKAWEKVISSRKNMSPAIKHNNTPTINKKMTNRALSKD